MSKAIDDNAIKRMVESIKADGRKSVSCYPHHVSTEPGAVLNGEIILRCRGCGNYLWDSANGGEVNADQD